MYKLYSRPGTGGFVVEAALLLARVPFECIDVPKPSQHEPDFLRISPLGQVPALVLPDGQLITESAAMCILLADDHPDAGLAPAIGVSARASFLRWMMLMTSVLYPAVLRLFYADRYTSDPHGGAGVEDAAAREMDTAFAILDAALAGSDGLAGSFSIADVYLLMLAHWTPEEKPRPEWTNIVALCERLKDHAVLRDLNAKHALWQV